MFQSISGIFLQEVYIKIQTENSKKHQVQWISKIQTAVENVEQSWVICKHFSQFNFLPVCTDLLYIHTPLVTLSRISLSHNLMMHMCWIRPTYCFIHNCKQQNQLSGALSDVVNQCKALYILFMPIPVHCFKINHLQMVLAFHCSLLHFWIPDKEGNAEQTWLQSF